MKIFQLLKSYGNYSLPHLRGRFLIIKTIFHTKYLSSPNISFFHIQIISFHPFTTIKNWLNFQFNKKKKKTSNNPINFDPIKAFVTCIDLLSLSILIDSAVTAFKRAVVPPSPSHPRFAASRKITKWLLDRFSALGGPALSMQIAGNGGS